MDTSITLPVDRPVARLRLVLLVSAVATAALYALPFGEVLFWPLRILASLIHEMGHGVAALLTGGPFLRLQVWPNGAGVAEAEPGLGRFGEAIMAAGGLIGPPVAAAVAFSLGRTHRGARAFLIATGAILLVAELLVVRGLFSLVFIGILAAVCLAFGWRGSPAACQWAVVFLSVQLSLSVFAEAGYLFMDQVTVPEGTFPSDTGRMAQALVLPHWFWGIACGLTSLGVLAQGVRTYWGK